VVIDVDIRTLPGEGPDEVAAHLRTALGDLADEVEVEPLMNDAASISRLDTPLWDALQRAVQVPFPTARLTPQFVVGFTDARIYREMGAVAYGAGLFSPSLDSSEYGSRFHGNNERIDIESLSLTTRLWHDVVTDLLARATASACGVCVRFVVARPTGCVTQTGRVRGSVSACGLWWPAPPGV
jgi:acetylornithine deacetylase/succinyl-diaminopimelate desuccinylase-like protein